MNGNLIIFGIIIFSYVFQIIMMKIRQRDIKRQWDLIKKYISEEIQKITNAIKETKETKEETGGVEKEKN